MYYRYLYLLRTGMIFFSISFCRRMRGKRTAKYGKYTYIYSVDTNKNNTRPEQTNVSITATNKPHTPLENDKYLPISV